MNNIQGKKNTWVGVCDFLKDQIITGSLSPGEKINEREIADQVKVSRTPVREALRKLEYEGYVTTFPKKGVFVKKYSPEELDVIHKMLIRLESLAMEMAVPNITEEDLTNLQKMNNQMKSLASRKDYKKYFAINMEFHLLFPRLAGSTELLDVISQLRKSTFRFYYAQITAVHNSEKNIEDHQDLIDALREKSKKNPLKILETHIERTRKSFIEFYRMFGP
jgi:DNA-binding GntR family transcriptional regulator